MKTNEDISLIAPCGIDCGNCECYTAKDNPALLEYLVSRGINREKLPCTGCRTMKGDCPALGCICESYNCVVDHAVDFCFECSDFPCSKLTPASDRANILPHNLKVHNLCYIQNQGLSRFKENSAEFKKRYYQGKMIVGKGPQL